MTTFTRKAAEELRLRLQETLSRLSTKSPELRAYDLSHMRLGTIHSLCWDMLTETPGSRFRHLQLVGALERAFFIYTTSSFGKHNQSNVNELDCQLASWIDKKSYHSLPSRWQWVKLFTSAYERLLNDQVDRARFASAQPLYKRLMQLVEEYETALGERHFTDQTLIPQQALELLRSPEGNSWIQSIQYVIVDEYQDFSVIDQRKLTTTIFLYHLAYCIVSETALVHVLPPKNLTKNAQAFLPSIRCGS